MMSTSGMLLIVLWSETVIPHASDFSGLFFTFQLETGDLRFQVLCLHRPQENLLNIFSNQMVIYECIHAVERRPSFWMDKHNTHLKFRAHTPPPSTSVSREHQCFQNFGHFFLWDCFQDITFSWANCFPHSFRFCSICSMPSILMTTGGFWLIWQRGRVLLSVVVLVFFFQSLSEGLDRQQHAIFPVEMGSFKVQTSHSAHWF